MKMRLFTVCAMALGITTMSQAQVDLNLDLIHKFNGSDFQYGTTYYLEDGKAVSLSRVQYYLSGFQLVHDGGQTTDYPDIYVLGSGNITNYYLGPVNVTTLEGINYDVGVDSLRNHMGTSNWGQGHPLASKSPTMDWNWPDGYFFWTISGMVDDNDDGTPNKNFELHGIGDHLLRNVDPFNGLSITGSPLAVTIYVNVADFLRNNDLGTVGFAHDGGPKNVQVGDNVNGETVFTMDEPTNLGTDEIKTDENKIYADYTVPYAPTIYYNLNTLNNVDVKVFNMSGQVVLEDENLSFEGNYFIRKELMDGSYLIVFSNSELEESFRFIVKN